MGGKSLTAHYAGEGWGTLLVVSTWYSKDEQQWKLLPSGNNHYAIVSKTANKCLDLTSKKSHYLIPSEWTGTDNQRWEFYIPTGEQCEMVEVHITSIYIAKADNFGSFGEPGDHAEWRLKVDANDRSWHWDNDYVKDGMTVEVDWSHYVLLNDDTSTIRISVSGKELDQSSTDDQLPVAMNTHTANGNWGIGQTRDLVGKSSNFHYTISYSIRCVK